MHPFPRKLFLCAERYANHVGLKDLNKAEVDDAVKSAQGTMCRICNIRIFAGARKLHHQF